MLVIRDSQFRQLDSRSLDQQARGAPPRLRQAGISDPSLPDSQLESIWRDSALAAQKLGWRDHRMIDRLALVLLNEDKSRPSDLRAAALAACLMHEHGDPEPGLAFAEAHLTVRSRGQP